MPEWPYALSFDREVDNRLAAALGEKSDSPPYNRHYHPDRWNELAAKFREELGCGPKCKRDDCRYYERDGYCRRVQIQRQQERRISNLRRAGFGQVHIRQHERNTIAKTPATAAVGAFLKALEDQERYIRFLILSGPRDAGKTFASSLVARDYDKAQLVKMLTVQHVGLYGESSRKLRKLIRDVDCLVLDDFGVEVLDKSGVMMAQVHDLIDARYEHDGPTVITSNLNLEDLASRYTPPIVRRIREVGMFVRVETRGAN